MIFSARLSFSGGRQLVAATIDLLRAKVERYEQPDMAD
jgi:hypothetical protein